MPTEKQKRNLRRGGITGTSETAARARAAKDQHREDEKRLGDLARGDPDSALVELWVDLAQGVKRLTRRWLDAGGDPSRELVNAWRECRLLTDRVADLLRERGADQEVRRLFGELDGRVATIMERVGEPKLAATVE